MPDYPSMADPNSLMPVQQDQPIQQGPTVQATAPTTNSLADIATLAIPALVGLGAAKSRGDPGLMGVMAGLGKGADAMQTERLRAQQYQQALENQQYRAASMQHMQAEAKDLNAKATELQQRMANEQAFRPTLTPQQRALYDAEADHKTFFKSYMAPDVLDSEKRTIVQLSNGQISMSQLDGKDPSTIHSFSDEMQKAFAKKSQLPSLTELEKAQHDRAMEGYQQSRLDIERARNEGATEGKLMELFGRYKNAREKLESDPWTDKDKLPPELDFGQFKKQFEAEEKKPEEKKPEEKAAPEPKPTEVEIDFSKYKSMSEAWPVLKKAFPDKVDNPKYLSDYYLSHGGTID